MELASLTTSVTESIPTRHLKGGWKVWPQKYQANFKVARMHGLIISAESGSFTGEVGLY